MPRDEHVQLFYFGCDKYMTTESIFISDKSVSNIDKNRYKIDIYGNVSDILNNRTVKHVIDNEGYHRVYLHTDSGFKLKYVHRLVKIEFEGFDPDPNKNQIDHVDCNKDNNFVGNLEWVTKSENALRGIKNDLYDQIEVVISEDDAKFICEKLKEGLSYKSISDMLYNKYNRNLVGIIGKIYRGERWKHISCDYIPFPPLEKDTVIPRTSPLTIEIINDICIHLQNGERIVDVSKYIQTKYNINRDLEDIVGSIKRRRVYTNISSVYNFDKGGKDKMQKPSKNEIQSYEESIKNYGNKIEHIETFVEAVRRFPGKLCTARHIRNGMK